MTKTEKKCEFWKECDSYDEDSLNCTKNEKVPLKTACSYYHYKTAKLA